MVIAPLMRQGAATRDGRGEIVTGMVMMLLGENSRTVVQRVKERLAEIQKYAAGGCEAGSDVRPGRLDSADAAHGGA